MGKYTKEEVKAIVENHNHGIDDYMNDVFPMVCEENGIPVKNGKISANYFLKAMQLYPDKEFYELALRKCDVLRECGWDVKINMQENKLVFYGGII